MECARIQCRFLVCVVLVFSLALPWGLPTAAQDTRETYTSGFTGDIVTVMDPWAIDPVMTGRNGDVELVGVMSGSAGVIIAWLPAGSDPVSARETYLGAVTGGFDDVLEVDRGAYGDMSYSLDVAAVRGEALGLFSLFTAAPAGNPIASYVFLAPIPRFGEELASAQASVMVNGSGVFSGVDGEALQAMLEGVQLPTPQPSPPANQTETGRAGMATPDVSSVPAGIGEGSYQSPQFDTQVSWDQTWVLDQMTDEPVTSDPVMGQDTLLLDWAGGGLQFLGIIIAESYGMPADVLIAALPSALVGESDEPPTVLLEQTTPSGAAMLFTMSLADMGGMEVFFVIEAACLDTDCDVMAATMLFGLPDSFAVAYADARAGISIDGTPIFTVFDVATVESALASARGG